MFVESEQSACLVCLHMCVLTRVLQKRMKSLRFAGLIVQLSGICGLAVSQFLHQTNSWRRRIPGLPHLTLDWLGTNVLSHHGVPPQVASATPGLITKGHIVS